LAHASAQRALQSSIRFVESSGEPRADVDAIADMIAKARSTGVELTVEAYPYGAGAAGIGAAMFRGDNWRERMGGIIQPGMDADIVVFDPESVSDRSNFERPAQTSVGFQYVLVNGQVLVDDGALRTDRLPGKAIRAPLRSP
jgi:hypothetical protein